MEKIRGNDCPTLKDLNKYVVGKIGPYWINLGMELGVSIELIRTDFLEDDIKHSSRMLTKWIETQPNATWNQLIEALYRSNLIPLAEEIRNKILGDKDNHSTLQASQKELDPDLNKFLNKAIKNNETIEFQRIKVFLSGSSAAGKTNLRYSLLGQKFIEEYESTHIQETKHAYIASNAGILESVEGDKIWSEFDLKEQLKHFKSLWEYRLEQNSKNTSEQNIDDTLKDDSEDEEVLEITEKLNESEGMSKDIKIQEPVKLISMIDTGGQPGYIHMLPAIIHMLPASSNCPTVNLVVIDMTKSLEDKVLVRYRKRGQKEEIKPYHLHYTNKDLIKLLLSVTTDSFNIQMPNTLVQATTVTAQKPDVHIGLVGTHKDILEKEDNIKKIRILDDQLSELVVQQNCKTITLNPESDRKYLYPVSNKASYDAVVVKLREKIEDLLNDVEPMLLPIKWMILELAVKLHCESKKIPYITYQEFLDIAKEEASIKEEEAKNALHYFHSCGILLNFQKVPKMSDYVIVEHQWLYDQLSMLVTVSSENPSCGDGIILKSKLPKIKTDGKIKMEDMISLLDNKKILAKYTQNNKEHYYLPFVLPYCDQYADKFKFLLLEPLLIRFSSGFLPRGFFCSLVVHFLQDKPNGWISLHENTSKHFRNVMTFLLPNKLYLRLQDKIYYLEVQVRHYHHHKSESVHEELEIICKYLHKVCETLEFDYNKLQVGFFCQHGKWDEESHMALLLEPSSCNEEEFQDQNMIFDSLSHRVIYCKRCQKKTNMEELHKLWFKETKESYGDASIEGQKSFYPVISIHTPVLAVVINNTQFQGEYRDKPREGSEEDVKKLKSLKNFGFEFDNMCFKNCTRNQIEALMMIIASSDKIAEALKHVGAALNLEDKNVQMALSVEHKKAFNCLLENKHVSIEKIMSSICNKPLSRYYGLCVCIMTHGEQGDNLVCSDGEKILLYDIASYFNAENCYALVERPKIFIVQACRGEKCDRFFDAKSEGRGHPGSNDIDKKMLPGETSSINCPIEADFLFAFATPNNYECYLTKKGSPFIQYLVETIDKGLERRGSERHLEGILLSVKKKVAEELIKTDRGKKYRQMPSIISQMRDKIWIKH